MKPGRFTEEQIIAILREQEGELGKAVPIAPWLAMDSAFYFGHAQP